MRKYFKHLTAIILVLGTAFLLGACGSPAGSSTPTNGGGGSGGTPTTGLVTHGIDTTTKAHSTWTTTAPHNSYTCNDCHSVDREKVCAQSTCHPFSKYSSLATNFNHTTAGTGEQCNKCHGMTPEPTATDAVCIAGWRENVKAQVSDTIWHTDLKGVCTNCHDPVKHNPMNTLSIFPASHTTDVTRQSACETCHFYKLNAAGTAGTWGGGGHPVVTSGCRTATCHTHTKPTTQNNQESGYEAGHHYDANVGGTTGAGPFECEWCHNTVVGGGYTSWSLTFSKSAHRRGTTAWDIRSCGACHPSRIP